MMSEYAVAAYEALSDFEAGDGVQTRADVESRLAIAYELRIANLLTIHERDPRPNPSSKIAKIIDQYITTAIQPEGE